MFSCRGRSNVGHLSQLIAARLGIDVGRQALTFSGRPLHPRGRLADYSIRSGSSVSLSIRVLGGGLPASFRRWLEPSFKDCFREVSDRVGALAHLARQTRSASMFRTGASSVV